MVGHKIDAGHREQKGADKLRDKELKYHRNPDELEIKVQQEVKELEKQDCGQQRNFQTSLWLPKVLANKENSNGK